MVESFHIPRALSNEALRLLTTLPMQEIERRLRGPDLLHRAADLLERQPLRPIPVSERLPGPEDCLPWSDDPDVDPWCWVGSDVDGGWEWEQRSAQFLRHYGNEFTHWLPAHALPLPEFDHE